MMSKVSLPSADIRECDASGKKIEIQLLIELSFSS